jgi:hypothetical protein
MLEKAFLALVAFVMLSGINYFVDGRLFAAIAQLFS